MRRQPQRRPQQDLDTVRSIWLRPSPRYGNIHSRCARTRRANGSTEDVRLESIEVRLLGPVTLWHDGREVPLARPHRRCVLAALAVTPGQPVATSTLLDRVWGNQLPQHARHSLHTHISALRRILTSLERPKEPPDGPGLLRRLGDSYQLRLRPEQVDLHQSRTDVRQARVLATRTGKQDEQILTLLRRADNRWRGTPLSGISGQWAESLQHGLAQEHLALVIERYTVELRLGEHRSALAPLGALVVEHPLSEPLVALQMQALYRCGQDAEAQDVYTRYRQRLVSELGAEPGAHLRQMHTQILRRDAALKAPEPSGRPTGTAARPESAGPTRPAQLPATPAVDLTAEEGDVRSVRAAFDLSYQAVPPPAQRLFRLLGVGAGGDLTAPGAAVLAGITESAASRLLDQLARAHLVHEHAAGRYTCHDLLRAYAATLALREDPGPEIRAAQDRLLRWYQRPPKPQ